MSTIQERRFNLQKNIFMCEQEIQKIKSMDKIELSPEQKKRYNSLNKMDGAGPIAHGMPSYKNEKDYLIKSLKSQIGIHENFLIQLVCDEKGHIESKKRYANGEVYATCKRCKLMYTRDMGALEIMSGDNFLKSSMIT